MARGKLKKFFRIFYSEKIEENAKSRSQEEETRKKYREEFFRGIFSRLRAFAFSLLSGEFGFGVVVKTDREDGEDEGGAAEEKDGGQCRVGFVAHGAGSFKSLGAAMEFLRMIVHFGVEPEHLYHYCDSDYKTSQGCDRSDGELDMSALHGWVVACVVVGWVVVVGPGK